MKQDINKSIHYLSLSANQENLDAQYFLGRIYYKNEYIPQDLSKSFHYFSLAASHNNPKAHLNLVFFLLCRNLCEN